MISFNDMGKIDEGLIFFDVDVIWDARNERGIGGKLKELYPESHDNLKHLRAGDGDSIQLAPNLYLYRAGVLSDSMVIDWFTYYTKLKTAFCFCTQRQIPLYLLRFNHARYYSMVDELALLYPTVKYEFLWG